MMKPRVLFASGREVGYMRNRVLIKALEANFDVQVLTPAIRSTIGRLAGGLAAYLVRRPEHDVSFAAFYGQPLAIAFSWVQRQPIILDAYLSTFDTLCEDRQWFPPRSPIGRLAHWLDRRSCQVAVRAITDTQAHADYFTKTFGAPAEKLAPVYVGCDEALFYPRGEPSSASSPLEVFYYGAFLPLHGTDVIIQAAALLKKRRDIHFTLGGDGLQRSAALQTIARLGLTNVDWVGWIPVSQLPEYIARASICLGGHFSTVPKAARVISTKTFQFVAMRKPTIVGDNPATREVLVHGEHVYAVRMGDPVALADAIEFLAENADVRLHIAAGGHAVFQQRLTTREIADQLKSIVYESCASRR